MSKLYIIKVVQENIKYEYEFGNLLHATEFISMEKQLCTLWIADTVTGGEYQMPIRDHPKNRQDSHPH